MNDNVTPIGPSVPDVALAEELFTEFTRSRPVKRVYSRNTDFDESVDVRGGCSQLSGPVIVLGHHEFTPGQALELAAAIVEVYDALELCFRQPGGAE